MSQEGWGAAAPQTRVKPLFFGKKLYFWGVEANSQNKTFFLYLLNEKTEFILSRARKAKDRDTWHQVVSTATLW